MQDLLPQNSCIKTLASVAALRHRSGYVVVLDAGSTGTRVHAPWHPLTIGPCSLRALERQCLDLDDLETVRKQHKTQHTTQHKMT